jgi:hypothetical protein
MEKVINEFKVIETDDGYRIEIKGDKEHMKKFFSRKRWGKWARRRHRGFPFGPMFWAHAAHYCSPWGMHEEPGEGEEEESEA